MATKFRNYSYIDVVELVQEFILIDLSASAFFSQIDTLRKINRSLKSQTYSLEERKVSKERKEKNTGEVKKSRRIVEFW